MVDLFQSNLCVDGKACEDFCVTEYRDNTMAARNPCETGPDWERATASDDPQQQRPGPPMGRNLSPSILAPATWA